MNSSESIVEISKALTKAWGSMENPKHNKTVKVKLKSGGQYSFEYTDLSGIIEGIKPHFKEHGISVMQHAYTEIVENRLYVFVTTKLMHESGEWMSSKPLIMPANNSVQEMGGQITYLKRYSLSAMLGISTEEDDDANGSSGNQADFEEKQSNDQPKKQTNQPKETTKTELIAKFKTGGGTEEQFHEWYAKQTAAGFNHNQMSAYLTKALMERNKE